MIPPEILVTFILASALLAIAPGPDNIFVLTQSAVNGRAAGILVTLGLHTGIFFHTAAVALGAAAIFQRSELAFTLLKLAGAAYLLYLAWHAFRAGASRIDLQNVAQVSALTLYRRGIIMNLTNPKVSMFFLAFLPQFASLERGPLMPQIIVLGLVFTLASLLVFGSIALLAGLLGETLSRSPRVQAILNRVAGAVFVGLAVKLALTER